jgi:LacI family transcriptional regulator
MIWLERSNQTTSSITCSFARLYLLPNWNVPILQKSMRASMSSPTLIDVAKQANVSKSTVSLVINGSDRVHPDTAARVWQVIHELNYVPNRAARALQSGRSFLIGIIVSDITNPYFAELVRSIITAAKDEQYDIFAFDTDYSPEQMLLHLHHLREHRPDGLILLTTERSRAVVERLETLNLPAVLLNWGMAGRRIGEVAVDYQPGMEQLIAHLAQLGHARLAFVTGPSEFYSAVARERAFRTVLAAHGHTFAPPAIFAGDFRLLASTGAKIVEYLAQVPPAERPTAIVASSDLMAINIQRALQANGWHIPDEISIVGIDDIALAAYVTPALTTLRLPRQRMGQLAFNLLKEMIDDPSAAAATHIVTPTLILRESAATAPPQ